MSDEVGCETPNFGGHIPPMHPNKDTDHINEIYLVHLTALLLEIVFMIES